MSMRAMAVAKTAALCALFTGGAYVAVRWAGRPSISLTSNYVLSQEDVEEHDVKIHNHTSQIVRLLGMRASCKCAEFVEMLPDTIGPHASVKFLVRLHNRSANQNVTLTVVTDVQADVGLVLYPIN